MTAYPFTAFNFSVEIYPDGDSAPLVSAAFADCDGLEMTMDVKTIREGGGIGLFDTAVRYRIAPLNSVATQD